VVRWSEGKPSLGRGGGGGEERPAERDVWVDRCGRLVYGPWLVGEKRAVVGRGVTGHVVGCSKAFKRATATVSLSREKAGEDHLHSRPRVTPKLFRAGGAAQYAVWRPESVTRFTGDVSDVSD
jgi:hypothetical protein